MLLEMGTCPGASTTTSTHATSMAECLRESWAMGSESWNLHSAVGWHVEKKREQLALFLPPCHRGGEHRAAHCQPAGASRTPAAKAAHSGGFAPNPTFAPWLGPTPAASSAEVADPCGCTGAKVAVFGKRRGVLGGVHPAQTQNGVEGRRLIPRRHQTEALQIHPMSIPASQRVSQRKGRIWPREEAGLDPLPMTL